MPTKRVVSDKLKLTLLQERLRKLYARRANARKLVDRIQYEAQERIGEITRRAAHDEDIVRRRLVCIAFDIDESAESIRELSGSQVDCYHVLEEKVIRRMRKI